VTLANKSQQQAGDGVPQTLDGKQRRAGQRSGDSDAAADEDHASSASHKRNWLHAGTMPSGGYGQVDCGQVVLVDVDQADVKPSRSLGRPVRSRRAGRPESSNSPGSWKETIRDTPVGVRVRTCKLCG
jgi:hypothetical protein